MTAAAITCKCLIALYDEVLMWVPWQGHDGAVLIEEAGSAASHQAGEGN